MGQKWGLKVEMGDEGGDEETIVVGAVVVVVNAFGVVAPRGATATTWVAKC